VRVGWGAAALWLVLRIREGAAAGDPGSAPRGDWVSGAALFVYAAAFSFAYLSLPAGTGALVLFGAVQLTMIGWGLARGERFGPAQTLGLALAVGGLVYLLLPGLEAPPLGPAVLMAASGAGWGVYSLRGRGATDPVGVSAGNFVRAALLCVGLGLAVRFGAGGLARPDALGLVYAGVSGVVTSALGYVLWYTVLPSLRATGAATVQLSVPVLAALGGALLLGEAVTLRLALATAVTLGGIALVLRAR
jgi:drug/metabolite transporter (DMT)-like permease